MKRWWRRAIWLAGFACLWLPVCDDPALVTGACVQDVGPERATVTIATAQPQVRRLELTAADGRVHDLVGDGQARRRHTFSLRGLAASTHYEYRVLDGDGEACEAGSIRTAPASDQAAVRFAVVGDSGAQPWWTWLQRAPLFHVPAGAGWLPVRATTARIAERIAAAEPDFVLHVGDIIYPWGHQGHYAAGFFRPFAKVLRKSPVYAVLGNHDVMDDSGRQTLRNFELPRGEVAGDERCYTFAWGPLRVVVVDLWHRAAGDRLGADHPAVVFLARELAVATEPWLVVASHYPIHSASRQGDRGDLLLEVLPLLERHAVDLYLCGHDHTYQRFGTTGELVQVVSGGGGKDLYPVRPHRQVVVAQSRHHWCSVEVRGRRLVLRARGVEGELLDTVDLEAGGNEARREVLRARAPSRARRIDALR